MSAKGIVGAMIAVSVVAMWMSPGRQARPAKLAPHGPLERPWLSAEAAGQIFGADGELGPLFEGAIVGGAAPAAAARARIAEFARKNDVAIDLEIVDDVLVSVRFDVTFGGCCGYEGADRLALRLTRPKTSECGCGCATGWVDDWELATPTHTYVRVRVRVNRVMVRWEKQRTLAEILERADALLGTDAMTVAKAAGYHWHEVDPPHRYRLDMPYVFEKEDSDYSYMYSPSGVPTGFGIQLVVSNEKITELSIEIGRYSHSNLAPLEPELESRWGQHWRSRPQGDQNLMVWRRADREITANFERGESSPALTIIERLR